MANIKKAAVILACVLVAICLCVAVIGCTDKEDDGYSLYRVRAVIKGECKEAYLSHKYGIDTLHPMPIYEFRYDGWDEENNCGYVTILLRHHGKKEVEKAIVFLESFEFVERAEKVAKDTPAGIFWEQY